MREKKFFVFDLDGVLVDSTNLGCQKVQIILERLGLPAIPQAFLAKHWGMKFDSFFKLIAQELGATLEQAQQMIDLEPAVCLELPYKFEKELFEALSNLKKFDYYVGLITSRSRRSLAQVVEQTSINLSVFDKIQTTDHYYHHKPDGRVFGPFINWARTHGVWPGQMVYIGDTVDNDFVATRDSDPPIDFIGVVSGANTREDFLRVGVKNNRILEFTELPEYLNLVIRKKFKSYLHL